MQTSPVNPALAQVLGAMEMISPTTPEGTPTVAAQVMQAAGQAASPPVQQAAHQAGLAAQIQNMQMQEAKRNLMRMAMSQQSGGLESLNPRIGNYAHGGIVGFAAGGDYLGDPTGSGASEIAAAGQGSDEILDPESKLRKLLAKLPEGSKLRELIYSRSNKKSDMARFEEERARNMAQVAAGSDAGYRRTDPRALSDVPTPEEQLAPDIRVQANDPNYMLSLLMGATNIPEDERREAIRQLQRQYGATGITALPAAQAAGPVASAPRVSVPGGLSSQGAFDRSRQELSGIKTQPVTPQEAVEPALAGQKAYDEYRRQMGLPAQMEQISRQEAEQKKLFGERERILQERMKEIEDRQKAGSLAQYLMGFRQMRGQSIGEGLISGQQAADQYETGLRTRLEKLQDLKLDVQSLAVEKQNALDKMRDDIAKGRFDDAMKSKAEAQKADNELQAKKAQISLEQAKVVGQQEEARIRTTQQPGELERLLARLEAASPEEARQIEDRIAVLRGAGRRPSPAETRQKMLELYADNWEKMDILEKKKLNEQGIKTYEDYVNYRDRIAGVAPSTAPAGGATSDLLKRADAIVGGR